jgi:methyl halide transferase
MGIREGHRNDRPPLRKGLIAMRRNCDDYGLMISCPDAKEVMPARPNRNACLLTGIVVFTLVGSAPLRIIDGNPRIGTESPAPCLRASLLRDLAKSLSLASGTIDHYDAAIKLAYGGAPQSAERLTAFEENRSFIYALGSNPSGLIRRLIVLNPSIYVVDDEVPAGLQDATCVYSESAPEISAGQVRVVEDDYEILWETPLPQTVTYTSTRDGGYLIKASSQARPAPTRYLRLFQVAEKGHLDRPAPARLTLGRDAWQLTASEGDRVFRFWLPPPSAGAGEIAISSTDGAAQMNRRPLPSGILPHGPEGSRLLESWDAEYRGKQPPAWDIGRPADELQKVLKEGAIRQCRVVDLGCGSGTDAIFLASHGFRVTGIDISPTALGLAEEKARKAGVSVQWVLADVTLPPSIGPFDLIYDRGCYHNVRDQNLDAYLETVRRFSRPGTKLLVLSARRDAQSREGSSGVTEEELRFDFSSFFDVESLRGIMLESNKAGVSAPGWSALLRRNAKP